MQGKCRVVLTTAVCSLAVAGAAFGATKAVFVGTPGPDTFRTLESVGYLYQIPPDTEFPAELRFWLYARFIWTGGGDGFRSFAIEADWLDSPVGQPWSARFRTGRVRIRRRRQLDLYAIDAANHGWTPFLG